MTIERHTAKTAPARKATGRSPAWALRLGSIALSLGIFGGTFVYAANHLYVTNAPLQPAVVATTASTAATTSAATTSTTTAAAATSSTTATTARQATATLSPAVQTTTRTPVTRTKSS